MTALPIEKIVRRADGRAIELTTVAALAESIAAVGLINPIRVRIAGDGWEVIAGAHRLEASKSLGLTDIEADIVSADDLHAELAMIDENLCRAELTPSDRAQQTARRKAIYLELHPETAHGKASPNKDDNLSSFAEETAAATGKDKRTVQRDAERGEKVIDEAINLIRGTALDTGTYLDKLKRLSPSEQVTAARRDLAFIKQQEREKSKKASHSKIQADVKSRAAKEVAEMIAEHVPGEWWDAIKSNLYAAGASNIANALTNITGEAVMDRRYGT